MDKVIIAFNVPKSCSFCEFCSTKYSCQEINDREKICCIEQKNVDDYYCNDCETRPDWCPVHPLPKRYEERVRYKDYDYFHRSPINMNTQRELGWNATINYIQKKMR